MRWQGGRQSGNVEDRRRLDAGGGLPHRMREWAHDAAALVEEIGRDQRREQHALRPDERPDGDLPVVESCRRVMVPVGRFCVGGHV